MRAARSCVAGALGRGRIAENLPVAILPRDVRSMSLDARSLVPLGLLAIALGVLLGAWVRASLRRLRLRRRFAHAALGEDRAADVLARAGYDVLARRVAHSWTIAVDGEPVEIALVADYLVAREEKRFVAEVKTGAKAPSVRSSATRRQMLEYRVAFDVDGVLLVDADEERVHEVTFTLPDAEATPPKLGRWVVLAVLTAAFVFGWLARTSPPAR